MDSVYEVNDLLDSERMALQGVKLALSAKHSFKGAEDFDQEDNIKRRFTLEAINRCAEIGLVVDVIWVWQQLQCMPCTLRGGRPVVYESDTSCPGCGSDEGFRKAGSPDCSDDPDDRTFYWNPRIVVTGRTEKLSEFDHERQKAEVRSGLLDGKVGEIRENGEFREDARKKNYYT
jgi:hypothetical protein